MSLDLHFMEWSPPSNAVILLANSLGVQLNLIHCDLVKNEHLTDAYLKLNPEHTIPTLVDNGFSLYESRAILIYLVQKYGKDDSLYPKDPEKRARVNQRLFFDLGTLYQSLSAYYYTQVFENKPAVPELYPKIGEALAFFDQYLAGQKYAAGDELTVADFTLVLSMLSLEGIGYDFAQYTNVVRWYEHLKATLPGWAGVAKNMEQFKPFFAKVVRGEEEKA